MFFDPAAVLWYFLINIALSVVVAYVAKSKGLDAGMFFLLSFLFSFFVGILVALAVPAATYRAGRVDVDCPFCKERINALAGTCKHCGKDVEPQPQVVTETIQVDEDALRGRRLIVGFLLVLAGIFLLIISFIPTFNIITVIVATGFLVPGGMNLVKAVKSLK